MSDHTHSDAMLRLRFLASSAPLVSEKDVAPAQPHPDADLLELCAEALDRRAESEAHFREAQNLPSPYVGSPAFDALQHKRRKAANAAKVILAKIGKVPSKTAAGVYAKALVLQSGYGAAPRLAESLAEDLVALRDLRAILWPAEREH